MAASFTSYETVDGFRGLLRQNLESVVSRLLGDMFSEELGVTRAAVDSMMAILKEQEVPPEQLEAKLKEIAERHVELTEKLHQLSTSNDEPEVAKRREQAAEAIERRTGGDPALLHRCRGKAGEPDNVTRCENVGDGGSKIIVRNGDAPSLIGSEANCLQPEIIRGAIRPAANNMASDCTDRSSSD